MFLNMYTCGDNQKATSYSVIGPWMQKLESIESSTNRVYDNFLVMGTWDYVELILIAPFIELILISDVQFSHYSKP